MKSKKAMILIALGAALAVIISGYFIYSAQNGANNVKTINEKPPQNSSLTKINRVNKSMEKVLLKGIERENAIIAESNKADFLISPASLEKDVVAIYQYGSDEYYIFRIRAVSKTNRNVKENILYAGRIVDDQFDRITRFYHLSNQTKEGDYFITEGTGLTYIFGFIPEKGRHFELDGKVMPTDENGLLGIISDEKKPDLEIKKDTEE